LFRTPGPADRFRSTTRESATGRRSTRYPRELEAGTVAGLRRVRGRSARGTLLARGVRMGQVGCRTAPTGSAAPVPGRVPVRRAAAADACTTHLDQQPLVGGVPRAGRTVCP